MYRFYDAWLFLYRSITLISSPDQRFFVAIRRVLETGSYLIVQFLMTLFSVLFLFFFLLGHMINFLIDMCYEIVHFCIPKFKIESVKSK